jgi:hypothetical protein
VKNNGLILKTVQLNKMKMIRLLAISSVCLCTFVLGQYQTNDPYSLSRGPEDIMFCVLSAEELAKCQAFAEAAARDHLIDETTFGSYYRPILCKQVKT